jgi:hypothetical protein
MESIQNTLFCDKPPDVLLFSLCVALPSTVMQAHIQGSHFNMIRKLVLDFLFSHEA